MIAEINDIQLYFDIEGPGLVPAGPKMVAKPPCLVLCGLPGIDHSFCKPLLSPLTEKMQLIYVDQRGHGRSSPIAPDQLALRDITGDLEALRGYLELDKMIVLGMSIGGMTAMAYAAAHPDAVSGLVLVSTAASHEWGPEAQRATASRFPELQPELKRFFQGRYRSPEEMRSSFLNLMPLFYHKNFDYHRRSFDDSLARAILSPEAFSWAVAGEMGKTVDQRDALSRIAAPTLIIGGEHDCLMSTEQQRLLQQGIAGSELCIFEQCGHLVWREELGRFVRTVKRFLQGIVDQDEERVA